MEIRTNTRVLNDVRFGIVAHSHSIISAIPLGSDHVKRACLVASTMPHSLIRPPAYDGLIDQSPSQRSNSATRRSSAGTRRSSSCARATSLDRSLRIPSATVWVSLALETPSTIPEACWCRSPTCLAWCRSLPCSYLRRRPTHWQWCRACCRHLPTSRPTNEIELPMPAYLVHT